MQSESSESKSKVDEVERLASDHFEREPGAERRTLFFLEAADDPPRDDTASRLGGAPFGVDADSWPYRDEDGEEPFTHIFTVDLEDIPSFGAQFRDDVRAFSLFVHAPYFNEAWDPGNDQTEVRLLTEKDVADGPIEGELPAGADRPFQGIDARELEVPAEIIQFEPSGHRKPLPDHLEEIRTAVHQTPAWGGAPPLWVQKPNPGDGEFLMQFDEFFASLNLGDMGIMYVYSDTAFWQCY